MGSAQLFETPIRCNNNFHENYLIKNPAEVIYSHVIISYLIDPMMEHLYKVETLKDVIDELEENYRLLQKDFKSLNRQHEALKRGHKDLEQDLVSQGLQFEQKLKLKDESILELTNHNEQLQEELEKHRKLLEESEKARLEMVNQQVPVADEVSLSRETNKQTREYHYRWKMSEQENAVLQTSVNRLENQVARYKESLEEAETVESELKADKRKLLRELRESQAKVEELETSNTHLQKRLDRLRSRNLLTVTTDNPLQTSSTEQK